MINMRFVWKLKNIFRNRFKKAIRYNRIRVYIPEEHKRILRECTVPLEIEPSLNLSMLKSFKDSRGKTVVVPIWKTELAKGSQN